MAKSPTTCIDTDPLAAAMHRSGRAWRTAAAKALAPLELTLLQWAVLQAVAERPGLCQSHLADSVFVEGPSLVRVLDGLEQSGWLQRCPDPQDRRAKLIVLSDPGHLRYGQALEALGQVHTKATASLTPAARAMLLELVSAMTDNLSR